MKLFSKGNPHHYCEQSAIRDIQYRLSSRGANLCVPNLPGGWDDIPVLQTESKSLLPWHSVQGWLEVLELMSCIFPCVDEDELERLTEECGEEISEADIDGFWDEEGIIDGLLIDDSTLGGIIRIFLGNPRGNDVSALITLALWDVQRPDQGLEGKGGYLTRLEPGKYGRDLLGGHGKQYSLETMPRGLYDVFPVHGDRTTYKADLSWFRQYIFLLVKQGLLFPV